MANVDEVKRLDAIVAGASELSAENQEYILTTIKGMLFTRNLLMKKEADEQPRDPPAWDHSHPEKGGV